VNAEQRQLRETVALKWMSTSIDQLSGFYSGNLGAVHRQLLSSTIKDFALCEDEQRIAKLIISQTQICLGTSENTNNLLAAMLYLFPHQMPIETNIELIPDWFLKDYCKFLFTPPKIFSKLGEVDGYYQYFKKIVDLLHQNFLENPGTGQWLTMGASFLANANFIPLYVIQHNLKDLYIKRAEITEQILKLTGFQLGYNLPQRSSKRSKIRLGVYSKCIEENTETFASLPVYRHLDPGEFEKYIYVHTQNGNSPERLAQAWADKFTILPIDIKRCVEILRQDDLDILFFSNNLTAVSNEPYLLSNHRVARIQCVHFCQPSTTGQPYMDYFILGDQKNGQRRPDDYFSEKIIKLQGSGICFDVNSSKTHKNELTTRKQLEIDRRSIVFVSGANFFKITPELCHLWAKVLSAVDDSIFILYPFGPAWSSYYPKSSFIQNFENVFYQYGIIKERIKFIDPLPTQEDVKELLKLADVYLDAVPYSGATSLLDPLEIGIPPIVMEGKDLRFFQGASILKELGVPELIAKSEEDYIKLAVTIAQNQNIRNSLKDNILAKMQLKPPFLNSHLYAQEVGEALKRLFYQHQISRQPDRAIVFG